MLLTRFFRRTSPTGPAGRHRAGPRHLSPAQVARTVAELAQEPSAEHMLRHYRIEEAETRAMRVSEIRDVLDEGRPSDPLRSFLPSLEPDTAGGAV
jgi:hypothetical protein